MTISELFDDTEEVAFQYDTNPPCRLFVPANDNTERVNSSPYSKQVRMTPFLHADGLGAFPSNELPKFIEYYLLPNGKCPRGGRVIHLTDDNGDDVFAAVIPEFDYRVGEPWGVETYASEQAALEAITGALEEAA